MTSLKETLWLTLEDLEEEEFKRLKWLMKQTDIVRTIIPHREPCPSVPVTRLEKADRQDTVALMVQFYDLRGALAVARGLLTKISRNDLVQRLSSVVSMGDVGEVGVGTGSRRLLAEAEVFSQPEDPLVPGLKPQQPITSYQKILQSNLQNHFMCVQEGLSDPQDKKLLIDIYTEVYITDGGNMQINSQHEVRQIETASRKTPAAETSVKACDIFKHPSGKYRPIRTVLTNGIAGIGKTFLVQKYILDWAEGRNNQDVHLLFPFTFRQLNLLKGKRFSLTKLIHKCIWETKDIKDNTLNFIFTALQTSGNTNYDKSRFKLLFVLDGLDENRLQLDFSAKEKTVIDVTKSTRVEGLLVDLMRGTLLPSSRLWITTRPAAANQIPMEFVDMVSEVRGFTDEQKEVYFTKRFGLDEHARRILSHIKTSRSLHIMCHIPVFCWITATVLEDVLKASERAELPRTLTEVYTEFLAFQMRQTKVKYGTKKSICYIQSLAQLAFHQLEKGNIIFYEQDIKESGLDVSEASVYSGVFTQVFRRESWRKRDKVQGRMFSFIHLTIQEFLAAFYVHLSVINSGKNVMTEPRSNPPPKKFNFKKRLFGETTAGDVHRTAIDKALESPEGHLDLFLRFLLGLSLETNQDLLADLLQLNVTRSGSNLETIRYIKVKIKDNPSPDRSINLIFCLHELNDHSLVEEIQEYLKSGSIAKKYLSPAEWSALVFILMSSEQTHDVFDLKKYCASENGLLRLLPVFRGSSTYLLSGCNLTEGGFKAVASVLTSEGSNLREVVLSSNNPDDKGVTLLSAGLQSPHCRVQSVSLSDCNLTEESCESLASVLSSESSTLRELDVGNNHLQDGGVKLLCAGLERPHCALESLRLYLCGLSWLSCDALASVLHSQSSRLKLLDLSDNDLQDSGVKALSVGLGSPRCRLETLRLSGCLVTEEGCVSLASALNSNPSHLGELDLTYNCPGDSGVELLSAGLEDERWRLHTLTMDPGGQRSKSGLKKYACDLTLDLNTVCRELVLSDDNRRVVRGKEVQSYPDHPERFCGWFQVLCAQPLTTRSYWEVEWAGRVGVAVAYRGIGRSGTAVDCCFGWNEKSWCLECTDDGFYIRHNTTVSNIWFHPLDTSRVAVYLDWSAGKLSFYRVSSDALTHLHTFYSTFTEPLYPGFWVGLNCSVTLCRIEEEEEEPPPA